MRFPGKSVFNPPSPAKAEPIPPPAEPTPIPVIPEADDELTRAAARKRLAQQSARGGRASTVLSEETLGAG